MTTLVTPPDVILRGIATEQWRGVPEHHPERSPVREPLGRWQSHPATITVQRSGFLARCERRGCDWTATVGQRSAAAALHTEHADEAGVVAGRATQAREDRERGRDRASAGHVERGDDERAHLAAVGEPASGGAG